MMQEPINIVLNEREPTKFKVAAALQEEFSQKNITSFRIPIGKDIIPILLERNARVLILDYLIGDYSTGLDIMQALLDHYGKEEMPTVIFLTDEPSISVAVQALKLGALDYIEIGHIQAIRSVVDLAAQALSTKSFIKQEPPQQETLADLVGVSKPHLKLLDQIRSQSMKSSPILVLEGAAGVGKKTIASIIFNSKDSKSHLKTVDISLYDGDLETLFGTRHYDDTSRASLGKNLSLILTNCTEDECDVLDFISKNHSRIWSANSSTNDSFLFICTQSAELSKAWLRLTGASHIRIPSLSERTEDIPLLAQYFLQKIPQNRRKPTLLFSEEIYSWLSTLTWAGEIKELKEVLFDAALCNANTDFSLQELIENGREMWSLQNCTSEDNNMLNVATAFRILEQCNFNYRIAAARLGCSVTALRKVLSSSSHNTHNVDQKTEEGGCIMNTQTSGKDTPRLHIAILGSSDFCRKMDSYITTARLAEKSFSASFSGAWELLSSHRPNVILLEIGTHYSESVHSWTRHFLSQVRERYGSEIFIITALLSPAHLGYGGDLLFEDETLHGSSFIDTFIAAPPSNIPSVTPLNAQLQNALSFCQEELQRRAEGQSALPTLNSNGWAQSLADPRSRELWMVWVPRYAKYTNENPIIIGETGTGKTNLALALHLLAGRSGKFISITPRDFSSSELIQAELFGAVEGAYTGAVDKWGLVKSAEKGTLFIDELQSIDKALQGKLITFIESKVYRRVGSTETTSADVRFVFASNEALFDLMDCDVLRHDFAYRLERVSLELPPLRERRLDIAAGLAYAIAKIHRQRAHNSRIFGISNDAYRLLFSHSWPGNLRQLENSTAKLCEMADFKGSSIIDAADVGKVFESKFFGKAVTSSEILAEAALDLAQRALSKPISSLQDGVSEFTTLVRSHALEATGGDLNLAAEKIADHAPLMTFVASNIIATKESEVKP